MISILSVSVEALKMSYAAVAESTGSSGLQFEG